jgi:hypothetical protein
MNEGLIHYGVRPLTSVRSVVQQKETDRIGKPNGLWLSVDTAWKEWCLSENFNLAGLQYATRVELSDSAKILRIASDEELDQFTEQYGADYPFQRGLISGSMKSHHEKRYYINWIQVAKKHDGIIVSPYLWNRRLHTFWYYGWDCASGVIWNAKAVKSLQWLRETEQVL